MFYEEDLVLEDTENVEEQTTEETVEGAADTTESVEMEEEKLYTEEEFNNRMDELIPKKIARREAKIRKEYEDKYSPYKEAESVLNAALGTNNITEATETLKNFYKEKGVTIPEYESPQYSEDDLRVLASNEAQKIIESGYEDVVEEVDRLADKGIEGMTPRERLVFTQLAEYRKLEDSRSELRSIGVKNEVIDSKEFKDFAGQFNANTPMKTIYDLYTKTTDNPPTEKIGSMKNGSSPEEKTYYTPEEVDRLTAKDLDDPKIMQRVRESMTQW